MIFGVFSPIRRFVEHGGGRGVAHTFSTGQGEAIIPVDEFTLVTLGMGYDAIGDALSDAIAAVPSGLVVAPTISAGGQRVDVEIDVIENTQAFRETLNISASASARGLVGKGSASLQLFHEVEINSNDVFALIYVSVVNETISIADPRLSSTAKAEWNNQKPPLRKAAFVRVFGDSYVSSITTGGEFLALFRLQTSSRREREEIKVRAKASFAAFKASGSYDKLTEFFSSHTLTKTMVKRTGGFGSTPSHDIASLLKAAEHFPEMVDPAKGGRPVQIFFGAKPISKVPDAMTNIDLSVPSVEEFVEDLALLQSRITDRLCDARLAQDNQGLFPETEVADIDAIVQALENARTEVRRLVDKVTKDRFQSLPESIPVQLERLPVPPSPGLGREINLNVKVATSFGAERAVKGGEWLVLGNDRIYGFTVDCESLPDGIALEYRVGSASGVQADWVHQGTTTRAPTGAVASLTMRITGAAADRFSVRYAVRFRTAATFYGRDGDVVSFGPMAIGAVYVQILAE